MRAWTSFIEGRALRALIRGFSITSLGRCAPSPEPSTLNPQALEEAFKGGCSLHMTVLRMHLKACERLARTNGGWLEHWRHAAAGVNLIGSVDSMVAAAYEIPHTPYLIPRCLRHAPTPDPARATRLGRR